MLTNKQQAILNRREAVSKAYRDAIDNNWAISPLVEMLSKKYRVSQLTIYNDIKASKRIIKNENLN